MCSTVYVAISLLLDKFSGPESQHSCSQYTWLMAYNYTEIHYVMDTERAKNYNEKLGKVH